MALSQSQIAIAQQAATALLSAGMSAAFLPLALAQLAHETAGFKSRVMAVDNNLSGIKFINSATIQKGATKGSASPEGNYYARFESINAWARDYIRIISRGTNPPIKATDTATLATRLKANGYYTDTVSNYAAALKSWMPAVAGITAEAKKKAS